MMEDNNYIPETNGEERPDPLPGQREEPSGQVPRQVTGQQPEQLPTLPKYDYHYGWEDRPDESGEQPCGQRGPGAYPPPYRSMQAPQQGDGFAVAAMIVGILSLMFGFLSGVGGIFLGALGIIFAILSRGDERMPTQSRIGMGLSIGGIALGAVVILALVTVLRSGAFQREFGRELERYGIGSELPGTGDDSDFYDDFPGGGGFYDDLPGV